MTAESTRKASIERSTKETSIAVSVDLDGVGVRHHHRRRLFRSYAGTTSRHSLIDTRVMAKGDLHIDDHHTVEDTGYRARPGRRQGSGRAARIVRYASTLPWTTR
ncbi:hypothetical protein VXQ18_16225 [Brucella abortus]|nr:hypothetical protein [Brucella abortus]